ncbi:MAG TPA: anti-sigma factor antagonist [Candidatus Avimonas sp.]|nr:anti-sigma factor antagonist [Clostridiales bacterium]HPU58330.1 anti-sigma factor antagonist [Candidatus Avimonas sp.]
MDVKIENLPEVMFVRLSGEIDHHNARQIREQVDSAVEMHKPKKLCLDFKDVTFMDSSGIGFIMGRYKLIQLYEGSLEIINISDTINRVIKLSGIDKLNIKISVNQR